MLFEVRERFRLSEDFLDRFRGRQPNWGPLGYVTYKRTYARVVSGGGGRTEEYWETLRRVVEGCYTIQLNLLPSIIEFLGYDPNPYRAEWQILLD